MPKTKNSIKIRHGERELYRIFKDLEKYNRTTFSYPNRPGIQRGIARTIGIRGKPLIDTGFLNPPTVTHNRFPSINVISIPIPKPPTNKKINVKERKGNKCSWFDFTKG